MKDDNLPPDNETVEDGGGNYVAGSREEYNAYLNYEDVQKELETAKGLIKELKLALITRDGNLTNKLIHEELTRLRSELQQERELRKELVEGLESVIRLKALIDYPQNTKEKHIGEAMAISGMLAKVESLIKKAKLNFD